MVRAEGRVEVSNQSQALANRQAVSVRRSEARLAQQKSGFAVFSGKDGSASSEVWERSSVSSPDVLVCAK